MDTTGKRLQFNLPGRDIASAAVAEASAETDTLPFTKTERLARDRANILAALRLSKGRISGADGAAIMLGIKPTTLASWMKAWGVKKPK